MTITREELKARWMAEAERLIDTVLAAHQPEETLTDIEHLAQRARKVWGEQVTAGLVEAHEGAIVPGPACPSCGEEMRYKGKKAKRLVTSTGEVTLKRAHYYCKRCRQGVFPPG